MRAIMAAMAVGVLAGCAKAPEAIAPAYVSPLSYRGLDCADLGSESARISAALAQVSQQQRQARSNDVVGIILLGIPVSSLSGDNVADQVGRLKGERDALHRASLELGCEG